MMYKYKAQQINNYTNIHTYKGTSLQIQAYTHKQLRKNKYTNEQINYSNIQTYKYPNTTNLHICKHTHIQIYKHQEMHKYTNTQT